MKRWLIVLLLVLVVIGLLFFAVNYLRPVLIWRIRQKWGENNPELRANTAWADAMTVTELKTALRFGRTGWH